MIVAILHFSSSSSYTSSSNSWTSLGIWKRAKHQIHANESWRSIILYLLHGSWTTRWITQWNVGHFRKPDSQLFRATTPELKQTTYLDYLPYSASRSLLFYAQQHNIFTACLTHFRISSMTFLVDSKACDYHWTWFLHSHLFFQTRYAYRT